MYDNDNENSNYRISKHCDNDVFAYETIQTKKANQAKIAWKQIIHY